MPYTHFNSMYEWRRMDEAERELALRSRVRRGGTWRRPPVWQEDEERFLITAACFEHAAHIGKSPARMSAFEDALLATLEAHCPDIFAQVLLPNHYHDWSDAQM